MKKLIKGIITILILALIGVYCPYYIHTCADCDELFFGPGYDSNILVETFSEEERIICKECAEIHHAVTSLLGKSVEEYRRPLFVDPVTVISDLLD